MSKECMVIWCRYIFSHFYIFAMYLYCFFLCIFCVQGNFHDAYRNMTYKHVMALKYAAYHCPRARYVLKTDDDVFVNMPTVMAFLSVDLSAYGARHLLLCQPTYGSKVKRSYRSKWRVSWWEFPHSTYPTYCPGWAVLYSPDVVFSLYREAQVSAQLQKKCIFFTSTNFSHLAYL